MGDKDQDKNENAEEPIEIQDVRDISDAFIKIYENLLEVADADGGDKEN